MASSSPLHTPALESGSSPKPIPGKHLQMAGAFTWRFMSQVIRDNIAWLLEVPRTTQEIYAALFCSHVPGGVTEADVLETISTALGNELFFPSGDPLNPKWFDILNRDANEATSHSREIDGEAVVGEWTPPKAPRKAPVWVPASGAWKTRVKKARYYLQRKAWVPIDAEESDKAMLVILCNLRRYYGLQASISLALVREHYNPRCVNRKGVSWAWDDQSILKKYRQAGHRGMYPTLGAADQKAKRKAARLDLEKQVKLFWKKCVREGDGCTPSQAREAFIRFRGGEAVHPVSFGKAVAAVSGLHVGRPFGKKVYRGIRLVEPVTRLKKKEKLNQVA